MEVGVFVYFFYNYDVSIRRSNYYAFGLLAAKIADRASVEV